MINEWKNFILFWFSISFHSFGFFFQNVQFLHHSVSFCCFFSFSRFFFSFFWNIADRIQYFVPSWYSKKILPVFVGHEGLEYGCSVAVQLGTKHMASPGGATSKRLDRPKNCLVSYWWRHLKMPCVLFPAVEMDHFVKRSVLPVFSNSIGDDFITWKDKFWPAVCEHFKLEQNGEEVNSRQFKLVIPENVVEEKTFHGEPARLNSLKTQRPYVKMPAFIISLHASLLFGGNLKQKRKQITRKISNTGMRNTFTSTNSKFFH